MQVNQAISGLPPQLGLPVFRQLVKQSSSAPSTGNSLIEGTTASAVASPREWTFGKLLLNNLKSPLLPASTSPDSRTSSLGESSQPDKLGTMVRDYRETLMAVRADLVSQLKAATETLKQAHKSGDTDAITAAQSAVDGLDAQIKANRESLLTVHDDVKALREMRQQLSADVKAGNIDAIQQDRDLITQQRGQLLADLQA